MKVVGLTGTIGAGKKVVRQFLLRKFNCYHVTLSDVIRGKIEKKRGSLNRKTLQDMGNELRQKYGTHILAKLAVEYLPRDKQLIVIDGIRNPGEVEWLRKSFAGNFVLIAVDAPAEKRFGFLSRRGESRDPKTWEEFVAMDERELGTNEPEWGLQVKKCLDQADFTLINDGTVKQLENKLNEIL